MHPERSVCGIVNTTQAYPEFVKRLPNQNVALEALKSAKTITGFEEATGTLSAEDWRDWRVEVSGTPYGDLRVSGPVTEMSTTPPK